MEKGQSLVEMLGMLSVIGMLSIAGIMGYKYAMDKYRSNAIIADKSPMKPSEEWQSLDHVLE